MAERYVCPVCGAESPMPAYCGGSFLDRDHPSNVEMVAAADDRKGTGDA